MNAQTHRLTRRDGWPGRPARLSARRRVRLGRRVEIGHSRFDGHGRDHGRLAQLPDIDVVAGFGPDPR